VSERRGRWVGVAVVLVGAACVALTAVFVGLSSGHAAPEGAGANGSVSIITLSLAGLAFGAVGGLLVSRVPGNAIGRIFCVTGAALSISIAGAAYARYAVFAVAPPRAGARLAVLLDDVFGPPCFGLVGAALLLFPTGRLPSRRWRPALWLSLGGSTIVMVGYAFRPGGGDPPFESVSNPLGSPVGGGLMDALTGFGWIFMGLGVVLAAVAMVQRLRRSRGFERMQLKWIAYAAGIVGVIIAADEISYFANVQGLGTVRDTLLGLALATFPVAAGIAILRHRLYDIDVVINRTLVYGLLTATLAGAYLGSVLLLQLALDRITSGSSLAVAVSTLAVAALFRPARTRIQGVVDRRFYRRKYDAARTLEEFSSRMREQVDLEALGGELRTVVREAMQPAHVSLWLRQEQR
jgi:hypothetical protein